MGTTTELRREIKSRFFPYVEQLGFKFDEREAPTFWIFRRTAVDTAQLFSIQWEKYGRPRFRLDFGSCSIDGLALPGKQIALADVHPHWLSDCLTLKPRTGFFASDWFRQDRGAMRKLLGAEPLRSPAEVVDELMRVFTEVESYWSYGAAGKHIRHWPRR